jgi:hypothetical protein
VTFEICSLPSLHAPNCGWTLWCRQKCGCMLFIQLQNLIRITNLQLRHFPFPFAIQLVLTILNVLVSAQLSSRARVLRSLVRNGMRLQMWQVICTRFLEISSVNIDFYWQTNDTTGNGSISSILRLPTEPLASDMGTSPVQMHLQLISSSRSQPAQHLPIHVRLIFSVVVPKLLSSKALEYLKAHM